MAYTPTTWNTGDTVNATKLNKMEQGIANAGSAMIVTDTNGTLDKTVQEIYEAMSSGTPVYISYRYGSITSTSDFVAFEFLMPVTSVYRYGDSDSLFRVTADSAKAMSVSGVTAALVPALSLYAATALDGYPVFYKTIHASQFTASDSRPY